MKLTKEQINDIKEQQSQVNTTKRVTAPELEKILYEASYKIFSNSGAVTLLVVLT